MTHLQRLTFLCYISPDCLTAEIHEKCRVFNAFRGLDFFGGGGAYYYLLVLFVCFGFFFFSHKDLVDFQPNKIVDTMNYMCLANWQT